MNGFWSDRISFYYNIVIILVRLASFCQFRSFSQSGARQYFSSDQKSFLLPCFNIQFSDRSNNAHKLWPNWPVTAAPGFEGISGPRKNIQPQAPLKNFFACESQKKSYHPKILPSPFSTGLGIAPHYAVQEEMKR